MKELINLIKNLDELEISIINQTIEAFENGQTITYCNNRLKDLSIPVKLQGKNQKITKMTAA